LILHTLIEEDIFLSKQGKKGERKKGVEKGKGGEERRGKNFSTLKSNACLEDQAVKKGKERGRKKPLGGEKTKGGGPQAKYLSKQAKALELSGKEKGKRGGEKKESGEKGRGEERVLFS